jgi:phosphate transport system permease protein
MKRLNLRDLPAVALIYTSGALVVLVIVAIFYYLAHEARYAFDRPFPYGYRFSLQPPVLEPDPYTGQIVDDLTVDPNATLLAANFEGEDGIDDKEEGAPMATLNDLEGYHPFGTGTAVIESLDELNAEELFRDNWKQAKHATQGERFFLFAFATQEYTAPTMKLAFQPDAAFSPKDCPFDIKLRLVQSPNGINVEPVEIDLIQNPSGKIELPTWIAKSDEDRTKGYVFEMVASPKKSNFAATLAGFFKTDWAPTLQYPRYGFIPLLLSTMLMALLALAIAVPVGLACSTYLAEIAPARIREWLKPIVEMLASIPTVVLGYFGLMIVAPSIVKVFSEAIGMTSGRSFLTASLVLAFLLLPTVISIGEDALRAVPASFRDGASALGFTSKETIKKVVMPAARAGIVATVLLAFARAIGETMIIWILSGGTAVMPSLDPVKTLAGPTRGMTDTIAIEMGNVEFEGPHYGHLFMIGLTLFLITLAINLIGYAYGRKRKWLAS